MSTNNLNPSDSDTTLSPTVNPTEQREQSAVTNSADINPYQSPTASLNDRLQVMSKATNTSKWYQLSGRIGRLRYGAYQMLMAVLMYALAGIVLAVFIGMADGATASDSLALSLVGLLFLLLLPFTFYNSIIYPKRRLHDMNQSGWWAILSFIPLVNILFILYLLFGPGNEGINQYGTPPRPNRAIHYIGAIAPIFGIFLIGILAAIALPAYQGYVERAQQVQMEQMRE